MKVYIVYTQLSGVDYYDLDTAMVFLDRKKAEEHLASYLIGDASIEYDDAYLVEHEVEE